MRQIKYKNATKIKLKNKSVCVVSDEENNNLYLNFKILSELEHINTPRAIHLSIKNKAVSTSLMLTKESAIALYFALQSELELL